MDPRIEELASILVNYSCRIKPGEKVLIDCYGATPFPLFKAAIREVYKAQGMPFARIKDNTISREIIRECSAEQLKFLLKVDLLDTQNQSPPRLRFPPITRSPGSSSLKSRPRSGPTCPPAASSTARSSSPAPAAWTLTRRCCASTRLPRASSCSRRRPPPATWPGTCSRSTIATSEPRRRASAGRFWPKRWPARVPQST